MRKTALQEYQKFISHRKHTEIILVVLVLCKLDTGLNIQNYDGSLHNVVFADGQKALLSLRQT